MVIFLNLWYKLENIKFCFSRTYGHEKCKTILKGLKDLTKNSFTQHVALHALPLNTLDSNGLSYDVAQQSHVGSNADYGSMRLQDESILKVKRKQGELKRNESERYLEDDVEDNYEGEDSEVSCSFLYGQGYNGHFISTISFKSAFSTKGRVLNPYHSSLNLTMMEA